MWKYLVCLMIVATSCAGIVNEDKKDDVADNVILSDIKGQWRIENVVENDTSYVCPSERDMAVYPYIEFKDDNTFLVNTYCNDIYGQYTQSDNAIRLKDLSWTELANDDMELEEMLKKILPSVNSVDCINDSVTRLNTADSESYIVLKKAVISMKSAQ